MVEVFKTDITKKKIARMLISSLSARFPRYKINIDLADCDKVLRIESTHVFDVHQVVQFIRQQNIYIEPLS